MNCSADNCKWMSMEACFDCLVDAKPCSDRVGPLVLLGLGDGSMKQKLAPSLPVQVCCYQKILSIFN